MNLPLLALCFLAGAAPPPQPGNAAMARVFATRAIALLHPSTAASVLDVVGVLGRPLAASRPLAATGRRIRGGMTYGTTDDFGYNVATDGVHVRDFHATLLHLLGIDHERLTFKYQGRWFRLTDIHGKLVNGIIS